MKYLAYTICAISLLATSGCASFNTIRSDRHTTAGQEMLDLKKAKEAGIITESQYNEQISNLLKTIPVNISAKIESEK